MAFHVGDTVSVKYVAGPFKVENYITKITKIQGSYHYFPAPSKEQGNAYPDAGVEWILTKNHLTLIEKKPFEVGDSVCVVGQMDNYGVNAQGLPNTNGMMGMVSQLMPGNKEQIRVIVDGAPNPLNPKGWWYTLPAIQYSDEQVVLAPPKPKADKKWKCLNARS